MNDWSTIAFWQHDLHKFVAFGAHDFPTLVGRVFLIPSQFFKVISFLIHSGISFYVSYFIFSHLMLGKKNIIMFYLISVGYQCFFSCSLSAVKITCSAYCSKYVLTCFLLFFWWQARNFHFHCGLVYVSEPGYVYPNQ